VAKNKISSTICVTNETIVDLITRLLNAPRWLPGKRIVRLNLQDWRNTAIRGVFEEILVRPPPPLTANPPIPKIQRLIGRNAVVEATNSKNNGVTF
jgi:hypothetical protein